MSWRFMMQHLEHVDPNGGELWYLHETFWDDLRMFICSIEIVINDGLFDIGTEKAQKARLIAQRG